MEYYYIPALSFDVLILSVGGIFVNRISFPFANGDDLHNKPVINHAVHKPIPASLGGQNRQL